MGESERRARVWRVWKKRGNLNWGFARQYLGQQLANRVQEPHIIMTHGALSLDAHVRVDRGRESYVNVILILFIGRSMDFGGDRFCPAPTSLIYFDFYH